jgi:hypothetical protein
MKLSTSRLGQSDLEITRVGIGTAPIGSTPDWRVYWGPQSESEAIRAIEAALDIGVTPSPRSLPLPTSSSYGAPSNPLPRTITRR